MKSENHLNHWNKLGLMLIAVIIATSTLTSCSTTPTTPRLPVPELKEPPPKLTEHELALLKECVKPVTDDNRLIWRQNKNDMSESEYYIFQIGEWRKESTPGKDIATELHHSGICFVGMATLEKMFIKTILYRNLSREALRVIRENNKHQ